MPLDSIIDVFPMLLRRIDLTNAWYQTMMPCNHVFTHNPVSYAIESKMPQNTRQRRHVVDICRSGFIGPDHLHNLPSAIGPPVALC